MCASHRGIRLEPNNPPKNGWSSSSYCWWTYSGHEHQLGDPTVSKLLEIYPTNFGQ